MKILNRLYRVFKNKIDDSDNLKKKGITNFDNSDFREETFKRNILFTTIFLFISLVFVFLYIFFRQNVIDTGVDEELPPLKIVVPYPNSSINIDDYEILKYKIKSGDTLGNILTSEIGVSSNDANNILNALKKVYNVSQLKVGQNINMKYRIIINQDDNGRIEEKIVLEELRLDSNERETEIVVGLNKNNNYEAKKHQISLSKSYMKYKVRINESLYIDGLDAGVPPAVMLEFIKLFSFDIDFQRDLRKGDTFEILFEGYYTDDGKKVRDGEILFAYLNNQGREYEMYRYSAEGSVNYFNKAGQSVQKSLLKTPINGARISSSYGVRKHPILGYSKLHSGKDFAAPTGTPFYAAGSGTIVKAQFWSSWGNYVKIKHTSGYETEYAHASRIASGIKPGVKVKQGQVIAYVGNTGRSTGPHLHYGIIYNGERINPDRVKSLPSVKLIGKDLINFTREAERMDLYRLNIPNQNLRLKK